MVVTGLLMLAAFALLLVLLLAQARTRTKRTSFNAIEDKYESIEEVQEALKASGLESSNLILGIDYTKSNEWNGKHSFYGRSLHDTTGAEPNPYERCISILGRTLEAFDEDRLIPCFGFGDVTTKDKGVFRFFADGRPCRGFQEALARYKEITPRVLLSGPTSFAPIIQEAIRIVEADKSYHILVIIADGEITREKETVDAIVEATNHPLSIIVVGVGDGPWYTMKEFVRIGFFSSVPRRANAWQKPKG
ncbi:E3 ubiquitin-protein ligase RGLG2, variant 2 [Balamuthia mandrillaris]